MDEIAPIHNRYYFLFWKSLFYPRCDPIV